MSTKDIGKQIPFCGTTSSRELIVLITGTCWTCIANRIHKKSELLIMYRQYQGCNDISPENIWKERNIVYAILHRRENINIFNSSGLSKYSKDNDIIFTVPCENTVSEWYNSYF